MKNHISIGLIGLGGMANHHIYLLSQLENVSVSAISDVNKEQLQTIGDKLDIPSHKRYEDYEELIRDSEVDAVISIVPNYLHAKIISSCIEHQKPIMTEKPFTLNFEEAKDLKTLYEKQPIPCMVGFSYRYVSAFRYAKKLLHQNTIGQLRHISVRYLQDWGIPAAGTPLTWRFKEALSGSGALGDLGSHMIDAARFFAGEFIQVKSLNRTFVKERASINQSSELNEVDVDDYSAFIAQLDHDIVGQFMTTRNAVGFSNALEVTLFGDEGTMELSCELPDEIKLIQFNHEQKTREKTTVEVPVTYRRNQLEDFIDLIKGNSQEDCPNFYDGFENQKVLHEIIESAKTFTEREAIK
ncbi:Gfo/Idh/MocA family protein [Fictibacillus barbaricus]|uniref:Dehydrogenase n=1 Tax=Fictibacillus barbaricus TaxID=182136 RepID=A0ABU1U1W5_9BACL|nr:Gfo/Idh/MocA family oxidoreductase [Fictibacillus barbaricus]MDR7073479.1 putative dehydrogenase [Fictibacillus barbaricus]